MHALITQFAAVLHSLTDRQRTAALAAVVGVGILSALLGSRGLSSHVPIVADRTLTPQEIAEARTLLRSAGIPDVRMEAGRLHVREADRTRAQAAIASVLTSDEPSRWTDEWERANERLGHFSGNREREAAREMARARQISQHLSRLPDIEFADVVWDEDQSRSWRQPQQGRATVYLKPRPGREITLDLVHAVRIAVTRSKGNLDPSDVAVMDLGRMITYDGGDLSAGTAAAFTRAASLRTYYRQQIEEQLSFIPGVRVTVHVDPLPSPESDFSKASGVVVVAAKPVASAAPVLMASGPMAGSNLRMSLDPDAVSPTNPSPNPAAPAGPVTASVAIPQAYYQRVAAARPPLKNRSQASAAERETALRTAERDVATLVRARVLQILPVGSASADSLVAVETILPAAQPAAEVSTASLTHIRPLSLRSPWFVAAVPASIIIAVLLMYRRRNGRRSLPLPSNLVTSSDDLSSSHRSSHENTLVASPEDQMCDDLREDAADPAESEHPVQPAAAAAETRPLDFLNVDDFSQWLPLIVSEEPHRIAIIMSQLPVDQTGALLARMPMSRQSEVIQRMAQLAPPTGAVLAEAAERLHRRRETGDYPDAPRDELSVNGDVSTFGSTPFVTPRFGEGMRTGRFVTDDHFPEFEFEHIRELPPRAVQEAGAAVASQDWAIALRGASSDVVRHILNCLARPKSEQVRLELAQLRPVRIREIEEAQSRIAAVLVPSSAVGPHRSEC